jgi:hypothetical protein
MKKVNFVTLLISIILPALVHAEDYKTIKAGEYLIRYFNDGSGTAGLPKQIENIGDTWSIDVRKDAMTDKVKASVARYAYAHSVIGGKPMDILIKTEISLLLILSDRKHEYVCVAGHDYPGMNAFIRVDKNPAIDAGTEGCALLTAGLEKQMRSGSKITLRGHNFPYKGADDQDIELGGFAEVIDFVRAKRDTL